MLLSDEHAVSWRQGVPTGRVRAGVSVHLWKVAPQSVEWQQIDSEETRGSHAAAHTAFCCKSGPLFDAMLLGCPDNG